MRQHPRTPPIARSTCRRSLAHRLMPTLLAVVLSLLPALVVAEQQPVQVLIEAAWTAHRDAGGEANDDPRVLEAIERLWHLRAEPGRSATDRAQATGAALHILFRARGLEPVADRLPQLRADEGSWRFVLDLLIRAEAWQLLEDKVAWLLGAEPPAEVTRRALYALGTAHRLRGNAEASRDALEKLIREHPDTEMATQAAGDLHEMQYLVVGQAVPDFRARDLDGATISPASLRGKVVLVDFWSTY